MDRKIDSYFLFDCGNGYGTYGEIQCDICKTVHNEGCISEEDLSDESISWVDFGDKTVCFCCYHVIENAVYPWAEDIIQWYRKITEEEAKEAARKLRLLNESP